MLFEALRPHLFKATMVGVTTPTCPISRILSNPLFKNYGVG